MKGNREESQQHRTGHTTAMKHSAVHSLSQ
jgi:hypothetical protein